MMQHLIALVAINARYTHTSLGARSLLANMGDLRAKTILLEFNINQSSDHIAQSISEHQFTVVGIGVYIWNRTWVEAIIKNLRIQSPHTRIILGGPEISHDRESALANEADVVVCGEAEATWPIVARKLLNNEPVPHLVFSSPVDAQRISIPDAEYTDHDIRHRRIYLETVRGCPLACSFCLSSLDRGTRSLSPDAVFPAIRRLIDRGCRNFRFIDRSFNMNRHQAINLLEFFAQLRLPDLRLHFEMTPDYLYPDLRAALLEFPPGSLHIETGIQSFNAQVLKRVNRKMDPDAAAEGIHWLAHAAQADVHADLIAGLPGETMESFIAGFNKLYQLGPTEIQLGTLKRLPGTSLHLDKNLIFSSAPPYDIKHTDTMSADDLDTVRRFASHWERTVNRRHYPQSLRTLLNTPNPWRRFNLFSRDLERSMGRTALDFVNIGHTLLSQLVDVGGMTRTEARTLVREDFQRNPKRIHLPAFLRAT